MSVFAGEHTRVLSEVIREIEVDPNEFLGAQYMPARDMPTASIFVDIMEARGGLTKEYTVGTDPQSAPRRSFRTMQYAPGAYKEFTRFNEVDILRLRELGQNDQSKRGIRQQLNETALILNNRIESRMELLRWQAIFNGTYLYDGKAIDFGKPAANDVSPTIPWGNSSGGSFTTANNAATPVQDLRFWITGGYGNFRKYKITKVIMNPNTERMLLDNTGVQSMIQSRYASDSYAANTSASALLSFLIPGMPEVVIYNAWYQPETIDPLTGLISVSDAVYMIPDGKIFFETRLPEGNKVGDVCMTLNLSNGDIDNPTTGKFIIVDEHIDSHPGNPYIDVYGGFYGGPRLTRPFNVLTATVI